MLFSLVKARLQLKQHGYLLLIFSRLRQGRDNGRVGPDAVQRLLDGQHVRITGSFADEVNDGHEAVIRVIEQHVLAPDGIEQPFALGQRRGDDRQVRLVLQVRSLDAGQFHEPGEVQRSVDGVHLERLQLQVAHQHVADAFRHVAVNLQPNDRTPVAQFDLRLHAGQQVGGFVVLDLQVGVAGDAERVGGHDVDTRKQHVEVGRHHFFNGHEIVGLHLAEIGFGTLLEVGFVRQAH